MTIKAIETEYKGYRFRSRLEARWAVFFDALGVEWEYEREGYETSIGRYLPDFWLPKLDCFAEVKPGVFTIDQIKKCMELPKPCILLDAPHPTARPYYLQTREEFSYYPYEVDGVITGSCYGWMIFGPSKDKGRLWFLFGERYEDYWNFDEVSAENAAKGARFEFEERVFA